MRKKRKKKKIFINNIVVFFFSSVLIINIGDYGECGVRDRARCSDGRAGETIKNKLFAFQIITDKH